MTRRKGRRDQEAERQQKLTLETHSVGNFLESRHVIAGSSNSNQVDEVVGYLIESGKESEHGICPHQVGCQCGAQFVPRLALP